MGNLSNSPFDGVNQPVLSSQSQGALPNFDQFSVTGAVNNEGASVSQQIGGVRILAYPQDVPKYVMTFSVQQYNRSSLTAIGGFTSANMPGIVLPMPEDMVDLNSVKWQEEDAGVLGLAAAAVSSVVGVAGGRGAQGGGAVGQAIEGFAGAAGNALAKNVQAFAGVTPNQFQVMLFHGPKYKRHSFKWQFSPQNFQEADVLRQVALVFKNAMSPSIVTVGGFQALWGFPCVLRIRLYPNSKWMYKFKPCVIEDFVVNYTPAGRPSFYRNLGGTVGENAPEGLTFEMKVVEMEYWTLGQFGSTNDPDDMGIPVTTPVTQLGGGFKNIDSGIIVPSGVPAKGEVERPSSTFASMGPPGEPTFGGT